MANEMDYATTMAQVAVGEAVPLPKPPEGEGWSLLSQQLKNEKGNLFIVWSWGKPKQAAQSEEGEYLTQA